MQAELQRLSSVLQQTSSSIQLNLNSKKLHISLYHIPNAAPVAQTEKITSEDRKPLYIFLRIEATIVRIMKEKGSLQHKELVQLVQTQLLPRCVVEKTAIKERLDQLVDREFLEREEGVGYRYKA